MPKPVITYDKDLPEISDRQPHKPPTACLRKKPGTADDYEIVEGRRPSQMLLVNRLRQAVDNYHSLQARNPTLHKDAPAARL